MDVRRAHRQTDELMDGQKRQANRRTDRWTDKPKTLGCRLLNPGTWKKFQTRLLTFFCVWNLCTFPVGTSELPSVKRTLNAVPDDAPADGQISSHVWAVGVDCMDTTGFISEHCQLQTCKIWNDNYSNFQKTGLDVLCDICCRLCGPLDTKLRPWSLTSRSIFTGMLNRNLGRRPKNADPKFHFEQNNAKASMKYDCCTMCQYSTHKYNHFLIKLQLCLKSFF